MSGLARIEARWKTPGIDCVVHAEEDVRLLVAVAKAAEDAYHADLHGHGHFYEEGVARPDCETCVALAGLDGAP